MHLALVPLTWHLTVAAFDERMGSSEQVDGTRDKGFSEDIL